MSEKDKDLPTDNDFDFSPIVNESQQSYKRMQLPNKKDLTKDFFIEDLSKKIETYLEGKDDNKGEIYKLISGKEIRKSEVNYVSTLNKILKSKGEDYKKGAIHKPKDTLKFLKEFSRGNRTKYSVHDWDIGVKFHFENWLKEAKNEFLSIVKKDNFYPAKQTIWKVYYFLFGGTKWGYRQINFSWSSTSIFDFCNNNPGIYPTRATTGIEEFPQLINVINQFKKETRFLSEDKHLLRKLRDLREKFEWQTENKVRLESKSLIGLSFYTDVDRISSGINALFDPIKKYGTKEGVLIRAEVEDKYINLIIEHIDSQIHYSKIKQSLDPSNGPLGDWAKALKNFNGQCDWTMEASFSDGKNRTFNYLSPNEFKIKEVNTGFNGVKHILKFYTSTE